MKAFLDKHLNSFISKKLSVMIVATVFLALGTLPAALWMKIAMVYIGSQAAVDIVAKLRG